MRVVEAAEQTWPPFVLVAGLLLLGRAAAADGLFEVLGARLESAPGGGTVLLAALLAGVAVTTAVLNLDTAVVFLTPVAVHAARRRGLDERAFLYGTVFMANAASLPLPASNLTNLLLLEQQPQLSSWAYTRSIAPAAVAAILVTGLGVWGLHRRALRRAPSPRAARPAVRLSGALGPLGAAGAAGAILVLAAPALVVLALGLAVTLVHVLRGRTSLAAAIRSTAPAATGLLFTLSVGLGTLARAWQGPGRLLHDASPAATAVVGALASVTINNLPSSVLLSATPPRHPEALLIGLNLGPNLAVTGSLCALLWWRAARATGAQPSARLFSRHGVPLAAAAITAALLASSVTA